MKAVAPANMLFSQASLDHPGAYVKRRAGESRNRRRCSQRESAIDKAIPCRADFGIARSYNKCSAQQVQGNPEKDDGHNRRAPWIPWGPRAAGDQQLEPGFGRRRISRDAIHARPPNMVASARATSDRCSRSGRRTTKTNPPVEAHSSPASLFCRNRKPRVATAEECIPASCDSRENKEHDTLSSGRTECRGPLRQP